MSRGAGELKRSDDTTSTGWDNALVAALEHAIEHLQAFVFDEGMERLAAELGSEAALRESVVRYEQGLAHLFGFVRACGVLRDAVVWSTLKSDVRRGALDAGTEITLRTALESGMYAAELVPLGDHELYRVWSRLLTEMLSGRAQAATAYPSTGSEEERLFWAYEMLADLEEHAAFHRAFVTASESSGADDDIAAAIHFQERLMELARFDLVLNASLLWLADHGAADA